MLVICSYCRKQLGEKGDPADTSISHSMCQECHDYFEVQWFGMKLEDYLDRFEKPVVAVDPSSRIIAANALMKAALGKEHSQITGFLGGEVMECVYARLVEGCGKTSHCFACTVRRTVMATMETGKPNLRVPAFVMQDKHKLNLIISTYMDDGFVRLQIEHMDPEPYPVAKGAE
jgi:hypothetical protein